MRKLIWLILGAALLTGCIMGTDCWPADLSIGKIVVNPLITANKTVADWVGVDTTIADTIILGKAVITEHRNRHAKFYSGVTAISTHDVMVSSHTSELARMRKQLQIIGFKDEAYLIQQSNDKDKAAGLKFEEWWQ